MTCSLKCVGGTTELSVYRRNKKQKALLVAWDCFQKVVLVVTVLSIITLLWSKAAKAENNLAIRKCPHRTYVFLVEKAKQDIILKGQVDWLAMYDLKGYEEIPICVAEVHKEFSKKYYIFDVKTR